MKAIFLDIDGVLNGDYLYTLPYRQQPRCQGYLGIGAAHVKLLAWIMEMSIDEFTERPKIILTSSWKYDYDDYMKDGYHNRIGKYLREHLRKFGIAIYETTTKYEPTHYQRGNGIRNYLKEHPEITSYAILDDEYFRDYSGDDIVKHLVKTDYMQGLTVDKAIEAICILNNVSTTVIVPEIDKEEFAKLISEANNERITGMVSSATDE